MLSQMKFPTNELAALWTNPTFVFADDGNRATYNNTTQQELIPAGFGFNVPLNATIVGIKVTSQGQGASGTAAQRQVRIGLTKDGENLAGTRFTGIQYDQDSDTNVDTGSDSDLWGTTWTPLEVNTATFGAMISDNDVTAAILRIDLVTITVYFTLPEFPTNDNDPFVQVPFKESIQFNTLISLFEGSLEQRRKKWTNGRRRFSLTWEVLTQDEIDELFTFYVARAGAFEAFIFTNPNDNVDYVCRFKDDSMTKERFVATLFKTGLDLVEANG